MDEADANVSKCVRCGASTTLVCKGCKAKDPAHGGVVAETNYCSRACQKEDWPRHKVFCKAARATKKGTMNEAEAKASNCARCGDPATLVCRGCRPQDPAHGEESDKTKYCSESCQTEDWPDHKKFCKSARKINRYWSTILKGGKTPASGWRDLLKPKNPAAELLSDETEAPEILDDQPVPLELLPDTLFNACADYSCAECQSPAGYACRGCKGAPDSTSGLVSTIYYCSHRCQLANWSSHKKACMAAQVRRKLYKAGTALQTRYLRYCEAMVMFMERTGNLDGDCKIVYEKDSVPRAIKATTLFQELDASSEEWQSYIACLVGSVHIDECANSVKEFLKGKHLAPPTSQPSNPESRRSHHHISNTSLSDLVSEVRQVDISMRILRRRFIREDQKTLSDKHQVLHVVMKMGEEYALDFSGLQFGLKSSTVPWKQYLQEHVHKIRSSKVVPRGKP